MFYGAVDLSATTKLRPWVRIPTEHNLQALSTRSVSKTPAVKFIYTRAGESPGLVVMGDNSCLRGHGFDPGAVYCMDLRFFTFICCKICIVCSKRRK